MAQREKRSVLEQKKAIRILDGLDFQAVLFTFSFECDIIINVI